MAYKFYRFFLIVHNLTSYYVIYVAKFVFGNTHGIKQLLGESISLEKSHKNDNPTTKLGFMK